MSGLDAARRNILEESGKDALRWHGEPVFAYSGSVSELLPFIPRFERRPFGAADGEEMVGLFDPGKFYPSGENKLWDVVVRVPLNKGERETPVGIVSKRYKLVQHEDLFCQAKDAIHKVGINVVESEAELLLSAYGTRMEVTFTFPEALGFDPGDGSRLRLRLYCVNSVDASSRLTIM